MAITDPTDIAGLQLWLDADDAGSFTLSGALVQQWNDKSGNANHFVKGAHNNPPDRVASTLNGRAGVVWASGEGLSCSTALAETPPLTVFVVVNVATLGGAVQTIVGRNYGVFYHPGIVGWYFTFGSGYPSSGGTMSAATPYYFTGVANGASSYARANGSAVFTSVNVGTNAFDTTMGLGFYVGVGQTLTTGSYICEVVLYDTALSTGDRDDVEAYLNAKWFVSGTNVTPTCVAATTAIPTPAVSAPVNAGPTAVAAVTAIPTPTVKVGIWKVSDRGMRNSTSTGNASITLTDPTLITVGNYLVCRVAVDNSGTNGALPGLAVTDSRSHTWTTGTGALQDPGVASAGASGYLTHVKVVTPFQASDTVTFTWTTGSPRCAIVIEEWAGIHSTTPIGVAQTTANNVSSTAQPSIARTPASAGQLMYVLCAAEQLGTEWGAQDTDTTNGAWSDVTKDSSNTGTADTSMSVYGGYKVVTAAGAQTWNNTLSATGDWATVAIVYDNNRLENEYATTVAAVTAIPTPTVTTPTGENVPAATVVAVTAIATPTVTTAANITVTAVAVVTAIPTPAVSGRQATPTAVAAVTAIATPAITTGVSIAVTTVTAVTAIATPTRTASANVTPTAVAAVTAIATPSRTASATVTVTAVTAVTAIATPAVTTGTSAAVTAVAAVTAIATPAVTTAANISVTAVAAVTAISTPSVTTGADANIAPNVVAAVTAIPTPAVATPTNVPASTVAAVVAIPTPAISTGVSVAVTRVAAVTAVATPTFTRTTTPTPTTVAAIAAVPTPVWSSSATVAVSTVTAVVIIGASAPFVSAFGGNATQTLTSPGATQTITLHQSATQTFTSQGASQEITPV